MAKSIQIKIKKGTPLGLKNKVYELRNHIEKMGNKLFGGEFRRMIDQPFYASSGIKPGSTSTSAGIYKLKSLYSRAWADRYQQIANDFAAASGEERVAAWSAWKAAHMGQQPYTGPQSISYTEPALMTGYLQSSVAEAFRDLRDTKHVQFPNLMIQGGFTFDAASYPHRVWPGKDGKQHVDSYSYVQRFIRMLGPKKGPTGRDGYGVLAEDENLLDFSHEHWLRIAQMTKRIVEDQFIEPVKEFLVDWEFKF